MVKTDDKKSPTKTKKAKGAGKKEKKAGPKRAVSAYIYFVKANREKVQAEYSDASFSELGKILGKKWKELTDKEKAPYEKQAAADKARYEKEKAEA